MRLAADHADDRVAYTEAKTEFILKVTEDAKKQYHKAQQAHAAD